MVVYESKTKRIELVTPTGQYDLTGLVAQLTLLWDNYSGMTIDTNTPFVPEESFQNTFNLVGSDATQQVSIQFLLANPNMLIDWKQSTIGRVLGYPVQCIGEGKTRH